MVGSENAILEHFLRKKFIFMQNANLKRRNKRIKMLVLAKFTSVT